MRNVTDLRRPQGPVPIEETELDAESRDDIPALPLENGRPQGGRRRNLRKRPGNPRRTRNCRPPARSRNPRLPLLNCSALDGTP